MKKVILAILPIFAIVLFVSGCRQKEESKMLDITINKSNIPEIINNLEEENILTPEEIMTFNNGLNRIGANNPDTLMGMSVRNIFELQKEFMKTNNYLLLTITATRIAMNMNYTIKYLGVKPIIDTINNVKGNTVLYEFKNNTDKAIKTINGMLQFYNRQNQLIKQFQVDNTEQIPPNASVQFYKAFAHNDKEPRDSIIRHHNAQLIVRWQPSLLEFTDGTKIALENRQ